MVVDEQSGGRSWALAFFDIYAGLFSVIVALMGRGVVGFGGLIYRLLALFRPCCWTRGRNRDRTMLMKFVQLCRGFVEQ